MIFCLVNCEPKEDVKDGIDDEDTPVVSQSVIKVHTADVEKGDFSRKILALGRMHYSDDVRLSWPSTGFILDVAVTEGAYVKKGDLLARIDTKELKLEEKKLALALETAKLKRRDMMISAGWQAGDSLPDPKRMYVIDINSGYRKAKLDMEEINLRIEQCDIYAPVSGWIHDIQAHDAEWIQKGAIWAHILNDENKYLSMHVLEKDAAQLRTGQRLTYTGVTDERIHGIGHISHIIPRVGTEGMVAVIARVQKPKEGMLMDGMKLSVEIIETIPDQLIVPKEAVVVRSGRDVVFSYDEKTSLAKWEYVTLGEQNDQYWTVSDGLSEGQTVIVEGNLNLSHDAPVERLTDKK